MPEGGVWKTTNGGDDLEADLRRRARRVGRRGRGRAVRSEHRLRRHRQSVRLVVHDRQGRLQVDRRRQDVDERRAPRLAVHRRHRRRSAQRGQRARRRAGTAPRRGRGAAAAPSRGRLRPSAACTDRPTAAARGRASCRRTASSGASDVYIDYRDPQIVYALLAGGGAARAARGAGTGAYKSTRRRRDVAAGRRPRTAGRRAHLRVRRRVGHARAPAVRRSPAAGGRGARVGAASIDPTTAARRGRSARASSRAPAARCTRTRRIPTSST